MWYWADPKEMISGRVKTPGVHLKAVAILKRQFAAYTLDCWVKDGKAPSYGKLGDALAAIQTGLRSSFPLSWFEYLGAPGKADELFEGFCGLFPRIRDDSETAEALRGFANGDENGGLAHLVATAYVETGKEVASILRRIKTAATSSNASTD